MNEVCETNEILNDENAQCSADSLIESNNDSESCIEALEKSTDDIFSNLEDVEIPEFEEAGEEQINQAIKNNVLAEYGNLSDEESINLITLIAKYREDPKSVTDEDLTNLLPSVFKAHINRQLLENGIGPVYFSTIARQLLEEIYDQAKIDANFNQLEEDLKKVLEMPAISDMYFEESAKSISESIPKTCEKLIEDGEIEKAAKLAKVKDAFDESITLEGLFDSYQNSKIKKAVRRYIKPVEQLFGKFDYENKSDIVKMNLATDACDGLLNVHKIDKWASEGITTQDVKKIIVLMYYHFHFIVDKHSFINQVKIYFIVRNIAMLKFITSGKTELSTNFISNIKKLILLIKSEEASYNETSSHNCKKRSKKSHSET